MTYTSSTNTDPTKATFGTKGADVLALQRELNKKGAALTEDGMYGPLTKAAVQKYSTTPLQNPPVVVDSTTAKNAVADMNKAIQSRDQVLSVLSYKDNADGTTTNYLSDGTTSTVRYTKNADGSLTPTEVSSNKKDYSTMTESERRLTALDEELSAKASAADAEFKRLSALVGQESPEEKAILDGIRQSYANAIAEQKRVNTNVETGTTIRSIRDNTQQFANAVQQGELIQAIDIGKNKILELENKMNTAISEAKSKMRAGKLSEAKAAYDIYKDLTTERRANLNNMADRATQLETLNRNLANDSLKARQEELKAIRDEAKLSLDERRVRVMERNAERAASNAFSNPTALTAQEAKAAGLPSSLIGVTDADIIGSFMSNTAPDWFKNSINEIYGTNQYYSPEGIEAIWKNEYLKKPEILAYRNAYAMGTKGKSGGINLDGSTGAKKTTSSSKASSQLLSKK